MISIYKHIADMVQVHALQDVEVESLVLRKELDQPGGILTVRGQIPWKHLVRNLKLKLCLE